MSRYESHNLENETLPFIYKQCTARPTGGSFGASNWHENVELLYVTEGNGSISNNGRIFSVGAGDVAMFNANHLHTLAADREPMTYRYLIVDRSFCLANGFDSTALCFAAQIRDERVCELLEALHGAYALPPQAPLRTLQIRALVLQLLLLLCREHSTPAEHARQTERSVSYVKQAIDYIRASCDKPLSLEEVAAFVGIHKCYLSREFHKYTGYPFVAYVNLTRCKMAQQMLTDTRWSIQEVGRRCGFDSPSYFARSFQRYVGLRPGEYRAKVGKLQET